MKLNLKTNFAYSFYNVNSLKKININYYFTDFIQNLELIHAKVPILKFRDGIQNLEVDLNCNNAVGVRNTHMLHCYSRSKFQFIITIIIIINNKKIK